jgi:enoyl-CoA hydratase
MSDYETLKLEVADFVATVTLDRPPVNAMNRAMREEIVRVFDELHDRPDVRAVVLTAAGKAFCAGADLKERPNIAGEHGAYPRHNRATRATFDSVMECGKPVIAAVNGLAIGAGCVLALCADILLVAEESYLSMTEVDVGLAGGVKHVRRHFGESDARLMIYTARRISGPELLRMNVASICLPREALLDEARKIGAEIAGKVPLAVQAAKKSFRITEYMPLHEGYSFEQSQTTALASTEDTQEAWKAFAEKRKPVFKGR